MDDLAAGIRSLWDRPYVQQGNAGIFGTSYGGTSSLMSILRHPEVFSAASASSAVTDWRHYDTIYTERYMWIPQETPGMRRIGHGLRRQAPGAPDALLWDRGQQRPPLQLLQMIAALQRAGRASKYRWGRIWGTRAEPGPNDGVLHRDIVLNQGGEGNQD